MHNTLAIARRELTVYFYAPVAYVFVVVFLLIMAVYVGNWAMGLTKRAKFSP